MSTRSIVYARTERGIKGVYVHYDGYPEGRLPVLDALIRRDGVSAVVVAILGKPSGWSHLSADQTDDLLSGHTDGRFIAVPGYGVQYSDKPISTSWSKTPVVQGDTVHRTTEPSDRGWDIEYVYVIEPDGSVSWAANDDSPWDSLSWATSTARA